MAVILQQDQGQEFGPSGANHSPGAVPDPGSTTGTVRLLCEDGTWKTIGTGSMAAQGSAGQVLTSNGTAGNPTFQTITSSEVEGTTTNDNAPTGFIGEYQATAFVTGSALNNNTIETVVNLTLSAGDWDISGVVALQVGGSGSNVDFLDAAVCLVTGSLTPIETGTNTVLEVTSGFGALSFNQLPLPAARGSFATSTTVYLNMEATISAGSATGGGRIRARRVR